MSLARAEEAKLRVLTQCCQQHECKTKHERCTRLPESALAVFIAASTLCDVFVVDLLRARELPDALDFADDPGRAEILSAACICYFCQDHHALADYRSFFLASG